MSSISCMSLAEHLLQGHRVLSLLLYGLSELLDVLAALVSLSLQEEQLLLELLLCLLVC